MDEIDAKQQDQIDNLQKENVAQDVWLKIYGIVFVIVLALFVGGFILSPFIGRDDKHSVTCHHENCPHSASKLNPADKE